jgi:hypothetical protein
MRYEGGMTNVWRNIMPEEQFGTASSRKRGRPQIVEYPDIPAMKKSC